MTVERPPSALAGLEIAESDVAYASPAGLELLARVYRPAVAGAEPVPALVAVHGGAWNVGSRTTGEAANRTLAAAGMVVVAIDFRQGPDHSHLHGAPSFGFVVQLL